MSDDEIVAGPAGATSMDARTGDSRPKYRSWRKKYRKMKTRFDDVMKESNALFVDEQKLDALSKRLQEQNDQLLDLLLDLNSSLDIPHELRFDLSQVPKTQQQRDMTLQLANDHLAEQHLSLQHNQISHAEFVHERQAVAAAMARHNADSLLQLEAATPHPQLHHPIPHHLANANPAFLSPAHQDAYLTRLDSKLEPTALSDPRPVSPPALSKLSQRELDREVELKNPLSVHNWLKKHGTIPDIDAASEGGASTATPATANKRRNLAKQVGDKAIERAREKEGSPGSTQDMEDELGMDDTPGKKKSRDDDQTYRPKGGRSSKSKRKREDGENSAGRGKKARTSTNPVTDA